MEALLDADQKRKGKGANKYTAYTYVTDTHKRCSSCEEVKEHKDFHKDKKNLYGKGLTYYCKTCANTKARLYHKQRLHDSFYKETKYLSHIKRTFRLSLQDITKMLQLQNNLCAICKQEFTTRPHIDHNHSTGKVRSLLCSRCNTGLGTYEKNRIAFEEYLDKHAKE